MKDEMKLFVVETIVTFRHRYVVKGLSADHAMDEVTMRDSGNEKDFFDEFSQKFISENIIDSREITMEEFHRMNEDLTNSLEEMGSPWMGEKMIRVIDYER